jgi:hypothetical protein
VSATLPKSIRSARRGKSYAVRAAAGREHASAQRAAGPGSPARLARDTTRGRDGVGTPLDRPRPLCYSTRPAPTGTGAVAGPSLRGILVRRVVFDARPGA